MCSRTSADLWRQPLCMSAYSWHNASTVKTHHSLATVYPWFDATQLHPSCSVHALQSWSLSWASPRPIRRRSSSSGASGSDAACSGLSLTARQVTLKQQRQANFVDVRLAPCAPGQPVGSNGVYALTDRGTLLLLRSTGRTVDRAIDLQVRRAEAASPSCSSLPLASCAAEAKTSCRCSIPTLVVFGLACLCRCRRPLGLQPHPSRWPVPAHKEWCGCLPAKALCSGQTCPT